MGYDVLLSDADGTLFDFKAGEKNAIAATFDHFHIPVTDANAPLYHHINDAQWKMLERGETTQQKLRVDRFRLFLEQSGFTADPEAMSAFFVAQLGQQRILLPGAEEFIRGEGSYGTPADPRGCYGRIYDRDGYILLAGVGHNRNTYLHCVEEILDVPNRLASEETEVSIRLPSGEIEHSATRGHFAKGIDDVSAQFPNYEQAFRYHGAIRDRIGNADAQLCSARIMKDVMALIYERSGGEELLDRLRVIPTEYYEVNNG